MHTRSIQGPPILVDGGELNMKEESINISYPLTKSKKTLILPMLDQINISRENKNARMSKNNFSSLRGANITLQNSVTNSMGNSPFA